MFWYILFIFIRLFPSETGGEVQCFFNCGLSNLRSIALCELEGSTDCFSYLFSLLK